LLALIGRVVPIDTAAVLAYRRNDIPLILFDRLQPAERGHFYEAYLSGVYLVSPFYRAFLDGRAPGFYPLRALAPQGFLQSEYYRKYYRHIGVADLIGGYVPLDKQTSLLLSFGRREGGRRFSRGELARLGRAEPVILALAARHWRDLGAGTPTASRTSDLHAQFRRQFESFGGPELTRREREVVRLLLRGHSAKSAARELEISPETLRVHRKHIYAKLGVSSQGDLFALFLSSLPGKQP
jgi:DNA-binding CsgD family transcriptional regulator